MKYKIGDILKERTGKQFFRYKVINAHPGFSDYMYDLHRLDMATGIYYTFSESSLDIDFILDTPTLTPGTQLELPATPTECLHTWQEYNGFTDSYLYCTKCDKKDLETKNA